jgi:transposase InsO family protein
MYRGFGPTLAAEKLGENHGIWASHDTVGRWLGEAGLLERTRRGRRSRRRRERKERFGQMVQMDGSPHAWFEFRGPSCVLMTVIDDATGRRRGWFHEAETLECAMDCFGRWVERFGVPQSLYVDRHSIYRSDREATAEELREGKSPRTQFGRAMDELGVELIMARSPQAKGRVERSNGVLQDRLVKELAGQGAEAGGSQWHRTGQRLAAKQRILPEA